MEVSHQKSDSLSLECPIDPSNLRAEINGAVNNLRSSFEPIQKAARTKLEGILGSSNQDIQIEIVKLLLDGKASKSVTMFITKAYKEKLLEAILNDNDFMIYVKSWINNDHSKLINLLEDLLPSVPNEHCRRLLLKHVFVPLFNVNTSDNVRDVLIDIAVLLMAVVSIASLKQEDVEQLMKNINNNYVNTIAQLREKDYPKWSKLWILLVKFCEKHLHYSTELTNKFLRVVEYAFRSNSIQQRLEGYECWKEIINNASLDDTYFCSPKRIKLLVTPLKAKFSKQDVVICKRFQVFVHLLMKLQHRAGLCLPEFLEFCFGSMYHKEEPSRTGQCIGVPQLWPDITEVLIGLIGHSHGKEVQCLKIEDVVNFGHPVITHLNFNTFYKSVIYSVGQCCTLFKEVKFEEAKIEKVINCLWSSVFDFIIHSTDKNKSLYYEVLGKVLDLYIQQDTDPYYKTLLKQIVSILTSYDKDNILQLIKHLLHQILSISLAADNLPLEDAHILKDLIAEILHNETHEGKMDILQKLISVTVDVKTNLNCCYTCNSMWLTAANFLISSVDVAEIEKFYRFDEFFILPLFNLHNLEENLRKQIILTWSKLCFKVLTDDSKWLQVLQTMENLFKNNPLLSGNVLNFLVAIVQSDVKYSNGTFETKLLSLTTSIAELPILQKDEEQKILCILTSFFNARLENSDDDIIRFICLCIKSLLELHKNVKIVNVFSSFLEDASLKLRWKFAKQLQTPLQNLFQMENVRSSNFGKELERLLALLHSQPLEFKKKDFPTGRSAKITKLAIKTSQATSNKKSTKLEPILKLVDIHENKQSPKKIKGSQLSKQCKTKNQTKSLKNEETKVMKPISEENSSDFVPIDSRVSFKIQKMVDHQKEMLKKRREDIPALYQDLSQSCSNDMFSSRSNSNSNSNENKIVQGTLELTQSSQNNLQDEENLKNSTIIVKDDNNDDVTQIDEIEYSKLSEKSIINSQQTTQDFINPSVNLVNVLSSNDKKTFSFEDSKKQIQNGIKEMTPNKLSPIEETTDNGTKRDDRDKKTKRILKSEINRLKMDIVGAEEFISTPKRTRGVALNVLKSTPSNAENDPSKKRSGKSRSRNNTGRKKQKHSSGEEDNDIIESSQDDYQKMVPLSSSKRHIMLTSPTLVQQESKFENDSKSLSNENNQNAKETTKESFSEADKDDTTATEASDDTQTQEPPPQSQDTITQPSQDCSNVLQSQKMVPTLYYDVPKKPLLTDSEQLQCKMDTMSICLDSESLKGLQDQCQTEEEIAITSFQDNDNSELNTTNPIPSSPITAETPTKTSILITDTIDISPIHVNDSDSPENNFSSQTKMYTVAKTNENSQNQESSFSNSKHMLNETEESEITNEPEPSSMEMLNTILLNNGHASSPKSRSSSIHERSSKLLKLVNTSSPSSRRISIKRRLNKRPSSPSSETFVRLMFNPENISESDILTFSREVPSPDALPRNGILKRKFGEMSDGEGISPCPKRKRVNFSDPCLTSSKIFIREEDSLPDEQDIFRSTEFDYDIESTPVIEEVPSDTIVKPIFPKLIDCKNKISIIIKKLAHPLFFTQLMVQLESMNVHTIGDLAQLNEAQINKLPLKVPALQTVYKVLSNYWKKNRGKGVEGNEINGENATLEEIDFEKELRYLMEKAVLQNIPLSQVIRSVLLTVDESTVLTVLKSFKFCLKNILQNYNLQTITKYVMEQMKTDQMFVVLKENGDKEVLKNVVMEYCLRECSLAELLAKKDVPEIRSSLLELVEKNDDRRKEIIGGCLIPLIKTPEDISNYLRKLSIVELENITVERIKFDNLDQFFEKIYNKFKDQSSSITVKMINATKPSFQDVVLVFKNYVASKPEEEKKNTVMDLFRFVSDFASERLNLENLINLHIEFLKKVPTSYEEL